LRFAFSDCIKTCVELMKHCVSDDSAAVVEGDSKHASSIE
jgi:hypothetical protein